jgi:hypothetical protein
MPSYIRIYSVALPGRGNGDWTSLTVSKPLYHSCSRNSAASKPKSETIFIAAQLRLVDRSLLRITHQLLIDQTMGKHHSDQASSRSSKQSSGHPSGGRSSNRSHRGSHHSAGQETRGSRHSTQHGSGQGGQREGSGGSHPSAPQRNVSFDRHSPFLVISVITSNQSPA